MYPSALHKNPTQTVVSSQVFEKRIVQNQPKITSKIAESWDKNTINDLEQVCLKQAHNLLSWLLSSKTTFLVLILFFPISHLPCTLNISMMNLEEKDWIFSRDFFS